MAPKKTTFTHDTVLRAALDVVRRHGWDALTTRSVSEQLGASVAPVYSTFGSMDSLLRKTLREIRRLLQDFMSRSYSELPFLNIGAGIVAFARDEPLLFQALFQTRHGFQDVVKGIDSSILSWMKTDAQLRLLADTSRERLYDNIGFYTMGLAAAVAAGRVADIADAKIVRLLKNMGNIVMFAEVSGIADSDSPESEREWARILAEKNIPRPAAKTIRRAGKGRAARPGPSPIPAADSTDFRSRKGNDP
ncbi:MAG: TetR/AcrR family transcriptional regulator [Candidatus Aminicenantes bacterium]|nr:TetR/AcrR family transcriptional regulator [Candidatus Aminicenantes bacterium]